MKKSEQKLRNVADAGILPEDITAVLQELSSTRRKLSKVKTRLYKRPLERMENDELYDLVVDLMQLFEEGVV